MVFLEKMQAYYEVTKPRLVALVMWTVAVGYLLAESDSMDWFAFVRVLIAVGLVASGSLVFNQWMERRWDAMMKRTAHRPLPSGRLQPREAFVLGCFLSLCGFILLVMWTHPMAIFLTLLTWLSYLYCYTPLKRKTSLNTLVGAIPGAIPPMIGWVAVTGRLSHEAWILFFILFFWQLPHFLALAWLYRDDYRHAGFIMLSLDDSDGSKVASQAVIYSTLLLFASLFPWFLGIAGTIYIFAALFLGCTLLGVSILSLKNLEQRARLLFTMSIFYLSILLLIMVLDKVS